MIMQQGMVGQYTTDNAAMIACVGTFKYKDKDFCSIDKPAFSKVTLK